MNAQRVSTKLRVLSCLLGISGCFLNAETVKDREGSVRDDKARLEDSDHWIYSDYRAALAKGKECGKPVMVTLRRVPCLACAGFDGELLRERSELTPLLDRFVCVRVINSNDPELSMFQFDYDLSFSALFFNGDGTLCGRFGSWIHQEDSGNKATKSMEEALESVLALHRGYICSSRGEILGSGVSCLCHAWDEDGSRNHGWWKRVSLEGLGRWRRFERR